MAAQFALNAIGPALVAHAVQYTRIAEAAQLLDIQPLLDRKPKDLSEASPTASLPSTKSPPLKLTTITVHSGAADCDMGSTSFIVTARL